MQLEAIKWCVLGCAVLMYVLIIADSSRKVLYSGCTALILIVLASIFKNSVFVQPETNTLPYFLYPLLHSLGTIINWNVLMIYLGSMIIASLFIYSQVPARIADAIVNSSKNTALAIIAILIMTGIISIFVENVATVLVMAPIALALCKKLSLNPTCFMIGLAVMSNLEGTATLVGDPPSMIFASYAGYNFNDFFFHQGKFSIFWIIQAGLLAGAIYFYFFFTKAAKEKIAVEKTPVISVFPAVLLLLMIFGLAGISFIPVELPYLSGIFVLSLGIIGLIWYVAVQKKSLQETKVLVKELDWETIGFLMGIFVVIGAIQSVGLLDDFSAFLAKICNGSRAKGFIIIIIVSVLISGFIDNVPYIMAMLPVASSLATGMNIQPELFMFALLIGSCLGGNLTPYGASANVVAMGLVKKEGYPIKFSGWLKIAGTFTVLTTTVSALVLWLLWT